jgi:hypothetical protein
MRALSDVEARRPMTTKLSAAQKAALDLLVKSGGEISESLAEVSAAANTWHSLKRHLLLVEVFDRNTYNRTVSRKLKITDLGKLAASDGVYEAQ